MTHDLHALLEYLMSERNDSLSAKVPAAYDKQRFLLRALLNVRPPQPIDKKWVEIQDIELQKQLDEKGVIKIEDIETCPNSDVIKLWQGDITRLHVDAIVNAANSQMLGCFIPNHRCIDNVIHSAAGLQLREECAEIMQLQGREEPTGSVKITQGYNLPARYVLHTVGPIIKQPNPTTEQEEELTNCYKSCLKLAEEKGIESIAFCCISTGEFRFPNELAAEIAVRTVKSYLHNNSNIKTVIFNVFKNEDYAIYDRLLR